MFEGPSHPFRTLELSHTSYFLLPFPSELRPLLVLGLAGVHFVFEVQEPLGRNQSAHIWSSHWNKFMWRERAWGWGVNCGFCSVDLTGVWTTHNILFKTAHD